MERLGSNDPLAQPEPVYEFDQRIAWSVCASAEASCLGGLVMDAQIKPQFRL